MRNNLPRKNNFQLSKVDCREIPPCVDCKAYHVGCRPMQRPRRHLDVGTLSRSCTVKHGYKEHLVKKKSGLAQHITTCGSTITSTVQHHFPEYHPPQFFSTEEFMEAAFMIDATPAAPSMYLLCDDCGICHAGHTPS